MNIDDIKSRINPQYSDTPGTESYERKWLCDRIAELESQNDAMLKRLEYFSRRETSGRIAELERQLAEARKDAERIDFIQINARCDPMMDGNHKWWPTNFNKCLTGPSLREAIDAALAATKEES